MTTKRSTAQSLTRVLIAAAAVLLFGLLVNTLTAGEGWSVFDFVVAEVLIAGTVLLYEVARRHAGTRIAAVLSVGVAAVGGAAVIAGEVDDAPGLILIGAGLVLTALWIGVRSVRRDSGALEPPRG